MLDAFIIEELRRREQQKRTNEERPRLELPVDPERIIPREESENERRRRRDEDRGVVIIDL